MYQIHFKNKVVKVAGFNYITMRRLSRIWKTKTFTDLEKTMQDVFARVEKTDFDALDKLGSMIQQVMIDAMPEVMDYSVDEVINDYLLDEQFQEDINFMFADSMEKMAQKKNSRKAPAKRKQTKK